MNRRGVTLIELLITVIIGSIAMFALAAPLIAGGSLFRTGKRQTEAQRDAQFVLRAIARQARQSTGYVLNASDSVSFNTPDCDGDPTTNDPGVMTFERHDEVVLHMHDCNNVEIPLIDGVRSQVQDFNVEVVIAQRLLRIQLDVAHRLRPADQPENEVLETEVFLRNGA